MNRGTFSSSSPTDGSSTFGFSFARDAFFSSTEDKQIHMGGTIMVYEEQLKVGLYEGANILLSFVYWLRTTTSLTIMVFIATTSGRGVGLSKINSEDQARKVVG